MMEPKANRQSRIKRDQLSLEKYLPLEERKRRAQARSLKRKEYQTKRVRKAAEALNSMTEYQVRCLYRWYWFADDIQEGKHGYSAVTRDVCDGLGYYVLQSGELYIDQNEKWFSKQSKRPGERPPRNPNIAWQTRKIGAKPPKAWDEEIQRLLDEYDVVPLKDITGPPPSYPHNLLAGERVVAKSDRAQPTN
jgi:hypothetical protein